MTDAELVLLLYCIGWTLLGHWYAFRRWDAWKRHRRRSIAAQKAAATRKMNGHGRPAKPAAPKKPRAKKKPLEDNVVTTDSAWFVVDEEDDEPDYNEQVGVPWTPRVRRFDGTAREYAARDDRDGSV